MKFLATSILLFAFVGSSYSQCANGICPAPSNQTSGNVQLHEGWYEGKDDWIDLYKSGVFIGSLKLETGDWQANGRPVVNLQKAFGKTIKISSLIRPKECVCKEGKCECADCPRSCVAVANKFQTKVNEQICNESNACKIVDGGIPNFGMDWHADGKEKYILSGQEVNKSHAFSAISGDTGVPDDSKMQRLVVLGSLQARQKVLADLAADSNLTPFKGKMVTQSYDPSHWHVKDAGYIAKVDPTIYITSPEGKVIHRQDGYEGPAKLSQAIRKADPSYDPTKDKDLNKTDPSNPNAPVNYTPHMILAGLAALAAARYKGKI